MLKKKDSLDVISNIISQNGLGRNNQRGYNQTQVSMGSTFSLNTGDDRSPSSPSVAFPNFIDCIFVKDSRKATEKQTVSLNRQKSKLDDELARIS